MTNPFDGLNDEFGVEKTALQKHVEKVKPIIKKSAEEDVKSDYEVSRAALHSLVMKGQEAVDGILEVAQASDHPRAYAVADTTDKLIDLQKKMKDLDSEEKKNSPSTVNNTMFVGSTAELQKMLKKEKEINKKDKK